MEGSHGETVRLSVVHEHSIELIEISMWFVAVPTERHLKSNVVP